MSTQTVPQLLTDEELAAMFELVAEADSVELKLTVPDTERQATIAALGIDPLDAELRQVFFFDTPDLKLNAAGLVVRARRVQRKPDDSVVKLRPVVPTELPEHFRTSPNMKVEVDAMPGGYVCSASMKGTLGETDVRDHVVEGTRPRKKLFSKEQRKFFAAHAPEGMELDDLALLGPILVFKLKFKPKGVDRKFVAELWNYPDNTRILELSTKCAPADAQKVADESKAFLTERGVDLTGEQQTKTKTALDYFSSNAPA
jgi:hypothetical protein